MTASERNAHGHPTMGATPTDRPAHGKRISFWAIVFDLVFGFFADIIIWKEAVCIRFSFLFFYVSLLKSTIQEGHLIIISCSAIYHIEKSRLFPWGKGTATKTGLAIWLYNFFALLCCAFFAFSWFLGFLFSFSFVGSLCSCSSSSMWDGKFERCCMRNPSRVSSQWTCLALSNRYSSWQCRSQTA